MGVFQKNNGINQGRNPAHGINQGGNPSNGKINNSKNKKTQKQSSIKSKVPPPKQALRTQKPSNSINVIRLNNTMRKSQTSLNTNNKGKKITQNRQSTNYNATKN